ncbi:MAG: hypothetical protein HN600_01005 [Bacteroidetes bacterium]|nr:hypothetical protein [Bacteroidota bacterium]
MKVFNIILIITTLAVLFIATLWDINLLNYSQPIAHTNFNEIELSDFRGLNRPYHSLHGSSRFAFISTDIQIKYEDDQICILSRFHPSRSYVYNKNMISRPLLTHELYHFHITEYITRLFRKELTSINYKPSKKEVKNILHVYLDQENQLQTQYDDETYHSYVLGKQQEWQLKIDNLLLITKQYENEVVYFK